MLRLPAGTLEAITAAKCFARPAGDSWLMARELLFAPLGGVGEIGMNFALYGIGEGAQAHAGSRSTSACRSRATICPAST